MPRAELMHARSLGKIVSTHALADWAESELVKTSTNKALSRGYVQSAAEGIGHCWSLRVLCRSLATSGASLSLCGVNVFRLSVFLAVAALLTASVTARTEVVNPDSPEEMSAFIVQEKGVFLVLPYSELLWLSSAVRSEGAFELAGYMICRMADSRNTKPLAYSIRNGSGKSVQRFEAEGRVFPFEEHYAGMIGYADRSAEDCSGFVLFRNAFDRSSPGVPIAETFRVFRDYSKVLENRLNQIAQLYEANERETKFWSARQVVMPDQLVYRFTGADEARLLQLQIGGTLEGDSLRVPMAALLKTPPASSISRSTLLAVYPWRHGTVLPMFYHGCPLFQIGYVTYRKNLFSMPRSEKLVPGLQPVNGVIKEPASE